MVPSGKFYLLLVLGVAIAISLASLFSVTIGILGALLFDVILLLLTAIDNWRERGNIAEITRQPLGRLSIGRDNPVTLSIKSKNRPALIQIRDFYPLEFGVSNPKLQTSLPKNSTQEISYTVHPTRRGEYAWGDIQVRQLGAWGLAWSNKKIPQSIKVAVYPDLLGLRQLSIKLTLQNTGTMRQSRRMGMGTEFAELDRKSVV